MHVGMKIRDLAVRLDAGDHAGHDVPAVEHGALDLQDRLPCEFGQLAQRVAVEAEVEPEALGHGEDELAVRNGVSLPKTLSVLRIDSP